MPPHTQGDKTFWKSWDTNPGLYALQVTAITWPRFLGQWRPVKCFLGFTAWANRLSIIPQTSHLFPCRCPISGMSRNKCFISSFYLEMQRMCHLTLLFTFSSYLVILEERKTFWTSWDLNPGPYVRQAFLPTRGSSIHCTMVLWLYRFLIRSRRLALLESQTI